MKDSLKVAYGLLAVSIVISAVVVGVIMRLNNVIKLNNLKTK